MFKFKKYYCIFFFLLLSNIIFGQNSFDSLFKPSDSLILKRRNTVLLTEAVLISATIIGLNQLWYADYPKSKFHFINDNRDWMQMDKLGHIYTSYHIGRLSAEGLEWSGTSKRNQLIYGASVGFAFLTAVEVMDGYSKEWGASIGDVFSNASGSAIYISQELLWGEQRIIPKFSFRTTQYAKYRPDLLGSALQEQILKDYNGQTYWLSVNLHSFSKKSIIPKWFNIAFGYGAEGMMGENESKIDKISAIKFEKHRQFYLSLDLNLEKIETNSHFFNSLFSIFNTVKIPAPTLEYSSQRGFKFRAFYF